MEGCVVVQELLGALGGPWFVGVELEAPSGACGGALLVWWPFIRRGRLTCGPASGLRVWSCCRYGEVCWLGGAEAPPPLVLEGDGPGLSAGGGFKVLERVVSSLVECLFSVPR